LASCVNKCSAGALGRSSPGSRAERNVPHRRLTSFCAAAYCATRVTEGRHGAQRADGREAQRLAPVPWASPAFVDTPTGASMRLERPMARRKRRKFTDEFKADAVKLCKAGGRSVKQVAADLDLTETALREWVKRAATDTGQGPPHLLTTAERDELSELRKRVKRLEMEREILKKAAAFFAKENA